MGNSGAGRRWLIIPAQVPGCTFTRDRSKPGVYRTSARSRTAGGYRPLAGLDRRAAASGSRLTAAAAVDFRLVVTDESYRRRRTKSCVAKEKFFAA
jgi:hypothetical protein